MLLKDKEFTSGIWSGRSNVENEVGLRDTGLESGLHDMWGGGLGDDRSSYPTKHCRAKIGEYDPESET